jgi:predicted transposase YdaD
MEGREEGFEEGVINVARNALSQGLAVDVLRDITGLSVEDIVKLQNEKS